MKSVAVAKRTSETWCNALLNRWCKVRNLGDACVNQPENVHQGDSHFTDERQNRLRHAFQLPASILVMLGALWSYFPHINWSAPHVNWSAPHINWSAPHVNWSAPHINWSAPHINWAAPHINWCVPHINRFRHSSWCVPQAKWYVPHISTDLLLISTDLCLASNPTDPFVCLKGNITGQQATKQGKRSCVEKIETTKERFLEQATIWYSYWNICQGKYFIGSHDIPGLWYGLEFYLSAQRFSFTFTTSRVFTLLLFVQETFWRTEMNWKQSCYMLTAEQGRNICIYADSRTRQEWFQCIWLFLLLSQAWHQQVREMICSEQVIFSWTRTRQWWWLLFWWSEKIILFFLCFWILGLWLIGTSAHSFNLWRPTTCISWMHCKEWFNTFFPLSNLPCHSKAQFSLTTTNITSKIWITQWFLDVTKLWAVHF